MDSFDLKLFKYFGTISAVKSCFIGMIKLLVNMIIIKAKPMVNCLSKVSIIIPLYFLEDTH
jgi:hypothetical protein